MRGSCCARSPVATGLAKKAHEEQQSARDLPARAVSRRSLLRIRVSRAGAAVLFDHLPWTPNAGNPPAPATPGPWLFFTGDEGRAVEALADRIIPPDPASPGGKDS